MGLPACTHAHVTLSLLYTILGRTTQYIGGLIFPGTRWVIVRGETVWVLMSQNGTARLRVIS